MPIANVNGVDTHYEVQGDGPPVLFIHGGFGGPATTLLQQPRMITTVLREGVRLITYDRRCAARSQYVLDWYSLEDLAADARALLEHLGVERSVVIGDSMGGMVAQQYALLYPQHVSALCLIETGADLMSHTTWGKEFTALAGRARAEGDRAVFESRKERLRNPPEPQGPGFGPRSDARERMMRELREALLAALAAVSDEDLLKYSSGEIRNSAAFSGYDFAPRLGELEMPVCVIHGDADITVPFAYGEALHAAIAHSEFHAIEDATHGVLLWREAGDALRDWVGRVAAADGPPPLTR